MSEAGSDNNDSPFECLTDQDTNGASGHSHTAHQSKPVAPLPVLTAALEVPLTGTAASLTTTTEETSKQQAQHPHPHHHQQQEQQPVQDSIINQFTPTSPLLPSAAWVNGLLSRVAETAKNSVDSVITTLDPGMREIIYSGGEVNIAAVIDSQEDAKEYISAIRDGFIDVFGRVTVRGLQVTPSSQLPATLIGAEMAEKMCRERISSLRSSMSHDIPQNQVVVTFEPFLHNFSGSWYSLTAVYLHDPLDNCHLITHTQSIPIPCEAINWLKCETPNEYPHKEVAFSKTITDWYKQRSQVKKQEPSPTDEEIVTPPWQESLVAISPQVMLRSASMALAKIYKTKLQSR